MRWCAEGPRRVRGEAVGAAGGDTGMDFDLTADQKLFRTTTRDFLDKQMSLPRVRELGEGGGGFERDWWAQGSELGWNSMLAGSYGDSISGEGLVDTCIVAEEMGRVTAPGPLLGVNVVTSALSEAANADEHGELITALMAGEAVASWAVYEPKHSWEPLAPGVRAAADGAGYVLSGVKDRVEAGDQADWFLVTAAAPDRLVQILVPAAAPGVSITSEQSLDVVRRYARVELDGVSVPGSSVVRPATSAEAAVNRQIQIAV